MIRINNIKNGILYSYILLLTACGGGSNSTGAIVDPDEPEKSVKITLTTTNLKNDLAAGDEIPVTVNGSWTGKNLGTDPVYIQARDIEGRFTTPVSIDGALGSEDLATKSPVWRCPMPGMLAISADRTLYIATGATASDGGLVAIKLN